MILSDKDALLLCANALPVADVWHEITQDEMISIHDQANKELARLQRVEMVAREVVACHSKVDAENSSLYMRDKTMEALAAVLNETEKP